MAAAEGAAEGPQFDAVMNDVRERLARVLQLPNGVGVILGASGTDVELLPLVIARALNPHAAQVRTVITAEKEIGRGVALAASGQYSNPQSPMRALGDAHYNAENTHVLANGLPQDMSAAVQARVVANRDAKGTVVDAVSVNLIELEQALAAREPLILHSVAGTKTDLREPYPVSCGDELRVLNSLNLIVPNQVTHI